MPTPIASPPNLSAFAGPERYVQGPGATAQLAAELQRLGVQGRVLLIAGSHARTQLEPIWQATFAAAGLEPVVAAFGGECTHAEIARLAALAREQRVAAVVGAGGGKAIDTARAAAADAGVPAVATPTLASNDAPCSALSVIYTPDGVVERVRCFQRHPLLVLVDSSVIARAPKRQLLAGIGDALATWYEARSVQEAHKIHPNRGLHTATVMALGRLCVEILMADAHAACAAVDVQVVTPALERVIEANILLSGLGFENGGVCVAHAVHDGITVAPGSHAFLHGEKVAFGLLTQLVLEGRPQQELNAVLEFMHGIGLPITLGQVGVDGGDLALLEAIAERACAEGETSHLEVFAVRPQALLDAMRAANRLGELKRVG